MYPFDPLSFGNHECWLDSGQPSFLTSTLLLPEEMWIPMIPLVSLCICWLKLLSNLNCVNRHTFVSLPTVFRSSESSGWWSWKCFSGISFGKLISTEIKSILKLNECCVSPMFTLIGFSSFTLVSYLIWISLIHLSRYSTACIIVLKLNGDFQNYRKYEKSVFISRRQP